MAKKQLAPFSSDHTISRGRSYREEKDTNRTDFQRDRDRIIHSAAFRRLEHKTQVFVHHEGDHYRSRLTHTLEVSQIARTISRCLGLDEDLSEAIALAHDLGHTPFGHAGEEALNLSMKKFGGFDHNAQTLRIITFLEKKYMNFDGLNLVWETLEGIVKHNGPLTNKNIPFAIQEYNKVGMDLKLNTWCGPEAQVASLSDDIAYFSHDLEDGVRANFFSIEEIIENISRLNKFKKFKVHKKNVETRRIVNDIKRFIISNMITDLINETKKNVKIFKPNSSLDVMLLNKPLVSFSNEMSKDIENIRHYLMTKMYKHWKVNRMTSKAKRIVNNLFNLYYNEPNCLPVEWGAVLEKAKNKFNRARVIADYIAGMTDRFAIKEHKKLFDF